jgi:SAM-dependent methyltransferase
MGRFYPRGLLLDVPGVFAQNRQPFRCVGLENGSLRASLAHPLKNTPLTLDVSVGSVQEKAYERGGSSTSWIDLLTEGAGMQARWHNMPTDFYAGEPFRRPDEDPDAVFYDRPRLVPHIDQTAEEMLSNLYLRFVRDEMRILDLMGSWQSHLPQGVRPGHVTGIGLNAEELRRNPVLTERIVQDLNTQPELPHADGSFDLALCALSVEYLTDPDRIFREMARVLAPDAPFVVSFSNRWFPTKAIQIWPCLHEFERMGLVLEYFHRSGRFGDLGTYTMRGLPRPRTDKYARQQPYADPIYAVWGRKRSS